MVTGEASAEMEDMYKPDPDQSLRSDSLKPYLLWTQRGNNARSLHQKILLCYLAKEDRTGGAASSGLVTNQCPVVRGSRQSTTLIQGADETNCGLSLRRWSLAP
jgi:hypothetical protein